MICSHHKIVRCVSRGNFDHDGSFIVNYLSSPLITWPSQRKNMFFFHFCFTALKNAFTDEYIHWQFASYYVFAIFIDRFKTWPISEKTSKKRQTEREKKTIDEMPRNLIVTMVKLYNYPLFCFAFILEWSLARALCQVNGVEQLERYY